MKEKVLITGASGFLGFHLIEAALANNLDVYAAVRIGSNIDHLKNLPITFAYPDFTNLFKLRNEIIAGQYDYIIHAAGLTKGKNEEEYNMVNAQYSLTLGKAAQTPQASIKKFVFISSLAAVGPLDKYSNNINELTPENPVTSYGKSKLLAEGMLQQLTLPLIILRPTAVYGPRDKDIFIMFKAIKRGVEIYLGKQNQRLSFIYVKDVANLAIAALFSDRKGVYNITDGNNYTRYDLAIYLKQYLNQKTIKFHLSKNVVKITAFILEYSMRMFNKTSVLNREKLNELLANNWACDIKKAKNELGFVPKYDLDKGLKESVDWYRQNKWL
ncbi:MAG: NAD(P)-dependent oxidoreductase [Lacibacter sp.]|jgi:nucleoside-diphosphate-sugar epimerase